MIDKIKIPKYIYNPKCKGSGIITCIPQTGKCPNNCSDCFFQSGRSYLEPLDKNLPQIPSTKQAEHKIVRMNDGNDSNVNRELVVQTALNYKDYFYNTSIPKDIKKFNAPVVLTINPGKTTDNSFYKLDPIPKNLMFVRIRTNMWNIDNIVFPAVDYYTSRKLPVVLTFMAYFLTPIPNEYRYKSHYIWKQRTSNKYWCLKQESINYIMDLFASNPYVYSCGYKGEHFCKFCGNCIREYYNTKERMNEI